MSESNSTGAGTVVHRSRRTSAEKPKLRDNYAQQILSETTANGPKRKTNVASPVRRSHSGNNKNAGDASEHQRQTTQLVSLEKRNKSILTEYIRIDLLTLRFSSPQLESEFYRHRTAKMRLRLSVVSSAVFIFSVALSLYNFQYIAYPSAQLAVALKFMAAGIAALLFFQPKLLTRNFTVYSATILSLVALLLITK